MREIKFRCWDKKEKTMKGIKEIQFMADPEPYVIMTPTMIGESYKPLSDIILMQYTGLKDKNGKEIYEGDIVKPIPLSSWMSQLYQVVFRGMAFGLQGLKKYPHNDALEYTFDTRTNPNIKEIDLEVIGNIYENPELLNNP